ncbi:MAG: HD-GYP domain-containing protein [Lachnospiraceae bacterium]|nr:HD-GYP domain-containing protein [Lachnospiraceae bacterium]
MIAEGLFVIGVVLLIVSQFTGLIYTIDATNHYQRADHFLICYLIPLFMLLLQASVIIQFYKNLRPGLRVPLILFTLFPIVATAFQAFHYGISLTNITIVGLAALLYVFSLLDLNETALNADQLEIRLLKDEQKRMHMLFEQTAQSLAGAIDAKDQYTHGHSTRVAEYSRQIAKLAGKSEEECEDVYFAALLHDTGKIGIPDKIINKRGKLTAEEYAEMKQHPVIGQQILSRISQSPSLSIGANFHHERYDGKGYPMGLKGGDIPEIARIIAVADAYDAMTSRRSYRETIPQQEVREELIKGMGNQFDPEFAGLMVHLIDQDPDYELKEKKEVAELGGDNSMHFDDYRSSASEGIVISNQVLTIRLNSKKDADYPYSDCIPTMILFDALDGRIHEDDKTGADMKYFEYGVLRFNGEVICEGARKMETEITAKDTADFDFGSEEKHGVEYTVQAVKVKDHMRFVIESPDQTVEVIVALPDSARFTYIALTGEHCTISNVKITKDEKTTGPEEIRRIAEEISYINEPEGDIPNVQIDGWRAASSKGIPVKDNMKIMFHSMSLPTSRLVWHCPYISLYYSDNGEVNGPHFREYVLVRLDGENWDSDEHAQNKIVVNHNDDFDGWEKWKEQNKQGMDCTVAIRKRGNVIVVTTENGGINIKSTSTIREGAPVVYAALTGDQCAITNIRVQ